MTMKKILKFLVCWCVPGILISTTLLWKLLVRRILSTPQREKIIHETYGTYFSEDGVRKAMTELQGLEWTGGDVFDDFC